MEEFEDLVPVPDQEGRMELTYRAWVEVDDVIWTMGRTLIFLDLSFNALTTLPEDVGDLFQLKELNISCNKITLLPESLGKLVKLKKFIANGNKIAEIPTTIGKCIHLTDLVFSENKLTHLPIEVACCKKLEILRLQNNYLLSIPSELGALKETITEINVGNNPELMMIPKPMRANTEIIMWVIDLHYQNTLKLKEIQQSAEELQKLHAGSEEGIENLKKDLFDETVKKNALVIERLGLSLYFSMVEGFEYGRRACVIS